MTVSRTWVMFTRKRQDMRSSCLANHVTPATPVTETKNCLYISCHTPLFTALVGFPCVGWDLSPSALEINSLLVFALLWWTCSLGRFGDTGSEHNKNQATGGDGIPVEPFQILKHDAVKVLHSICQQIWKVQQWPHDWKRPVFILILKKANAKECLNYHTIAFISHASKVMPQILQTRLEQYVNRELADVQAEFRKGRATRD